VRNLIEFSMMSVDINNMLENLKNCIKLCIDL